jgi:hypothetical protein
MNRIFIICLFLPFAPSTNACGQIKDSIGFSISKVPGFEKMNDLYEVRIINGREDPVCIMHSAYINLLFDPPQRLALLKRDKSIEIFSLHYVARDTLNNYENSNPSYNAEPILPYQEIKFRLFIPKSEHDKRILFEYMILPDFCYRDFKRAIFANTATWYEKYQKKEATFKLP